MATCLTRSPQPSTPCSTACRPTRCGAPRHRSSTPTAAGHRPPGRCCATPPPPRLTRPTGCRPRTPRSRAPCAMPQTSPPASRWARSSTSVGARVRRAGPRPRRSRGSSASRCSTGRPTPWPSGRGSGGTGRRRSPRPPGPGCSSAPGVALPTADLAVVSYLLGELPDPMHAPVVDAAVAAASTAVLVVEPGTPRGYAAVLAARSRLTAAGWHVLAPCPQDGPCPVAARPGDWCHFAARLDRTALHRRLKGARLGHEDEKFSYVLATRTPGGSAAGSGAAASGHPQGPRAARGLRRGGVHAAGRGHEARPDRLPCSTRRLVGKSLARAGGGTPARRGPLIASK